MAETSPGESPASHRSEKPSTKNGDSHGSSEKSAGHTASHHQAFWLWVMCLTGVDYFSTLGYQPSIAFEAAGRLAPLATVILIVVTLLGALPVYCYVAGKSPHGQGSIAMLERLVHGWTGKLIVLVLLGFAATDFVITKTLSAADAVVHVLHNPLWAKMPAWVHEFSEDRQRLILTMFLLVALGASFLRGFKEVIGLAAGIVAVYLVLNLVVIGSGVAYALSHPSLINDWWTAVVTRDWHVEHDFGIKGTGSLAIAAICALIFPKLALGLSGFETGVAVMPLIRGREGDDAHAPHGRIVNARKLLFTAATIMSVMLLGSALVTATVIEPSALGSGGDAKDRALAYLAHGESPHPLNPMFGEVFGTIYDASTVIILWFAGASAMAGLLNLVPQYLPRYGMAPEWARISWPLVLLFTVVNLFVTWVFDASVEAQGGAYATGVLVLMSSACLATVIDCWRRKQELGWIAWPLTAFFFVVMLVFFFTTGANMFERPDGIKIATFFILAVIAASFGSRLKRSTELRFSGFDFANPESRFLWDSLKHLEFPILVPHRPGGERDLIEKDQNIRQRHRIAAEVPIVFIEAVLGDPSEFHHAPLMEIHEDHGRFVIGVTRCASIAHVIATIALELSKFGKPPEIHFGWSDESTMRASANFLLFGQGNVPWMVRELIRKDQPDTTRRPDVYIG